jgi:hypothetical protein
MKKFAVLLIYSFFILSCHFSSQKILKPTEYKPCDELIAFLKKEFKRDGKGVLRTTQEASSFIMGIGNATSFDTIIKTKMQNLLTNQNGGRCYITDFYAILGKPDFQGVHPYHKMHYCMYFIASSCCNYCPKGEIRSSGYYDYKLKRGYNTSYQCHKLEIRFHPDSKAILALFIN